MPTFNRNTDKNGFEISFEDIPEESIRTELVFASRYYQENIQGESLQYIFDSSRTEKPHPSVFTNKD